MIVAASFVVVAGHTFHFVPMCREVRRGGVAVGWKVIHRNHVTLDNRQENLCLVRECEPPPPPAAAASVPGLEVHEVMSGSGKNGEGGLYWTTILRLMSDPVEQVCSILLLNCVSVSGV